MTIQNGEIHLQVPEIAPAPDGPTTNGHPVAAARGSVSVDQPPTLKANEFRPADLEPGDVIELEAGGEEVVVYDVAGTFYATPAECTHQGGPLNDGELNGKVVTCPWHGSRFDVTTGQVVRGPAKAALKTYRVVVEGEVARVQGSG